MLKRPLVFGSKGNMGQRYCAILKHLGMQYRGIDIGDQMIGPGGFDSIILATPTLNHVSEIRKCLKANVPILCEKPFSKNIGEIMDLCQEAENANVPVKMVNQYEFLSNRETIGSTHYDYFKHGSDGLAWDCINILGMATGIVTLAEESPFWVCQINGKSLNLSGMDMAYVEMISTWLSGNCNGTDYIRFAHQKASEFECQRLS